MLHALRTSEQRMAIATALHAGSRLHKHGSVWLPKRTYDTKPPRIDAVQDDVVQALIEQGVFRMSKVWPDRVEVLTRPFELGGIYRLAGGGTVKIIERNDDKQGYEWVRGDDISENATAGICRYNRDGSDRGRVTGSDHDWLDPRNLVPEVIDG